MRFNKHFIIFALLAVMLVFCVSAVSAEDSSNMTLTSDSADTIAAADVGEVAASDTSEEVLSVDDDVIYVNGDYMGEEELGTLNKPYTSISKAISGTTVNKSTIFVKNGEYEISSAITLPSNNGFSIIGESTDGVIIRGSGSYVYLFKGNLNNYDVTLNNLTFINTYNSYALNIGGTGNLNIEGCIFDNFNTYTSSNSAFIISCSNSTMKSTEIINLNSKNSNGPAFITYGSGSHIIEDTVIDKFAVTNSLKGGVISVNANANVQANNLTISNINAAINLGMIQVSGRFSAKNSNFKNNVLKTGSSVSNVYSLFYVNNGNLTIETSSISHNSGFNYLIQENGGNSISTVNYNGIIGNTPKVSLVSTIGNSNFNYNWWGTNDKPGDFAENWVLMNFSLDKNVDNIDITADFSKYTNGSETYDLSKNLNFPIIVKSSHGTLDSEIWTENNIAAVSFKSNGDFYVDVDTGSKVTLPLGIIYVDSNFTGEELGTQDNPFKSISNAVKSTTGWETIYIKNGNYTENKVITLTNSLNFIGESEGGVIITGSNKGIFNNPFYMSKELTLLFTNLTFKDVKCTANNAALYLGKSVVELNITNCIFDDCSGRWGSINIESSDLTMDNCKILNSKSTSDDMGTAAIYFNSDGNYVIRNTMISGCEGIGENVKGIIVSQNNNAFLTLDNVQIINNIVSSQSVISGGKLNIKNSKFKNNTVEFKNPTSLIDVCAESTIQNTIFDENSVYRIIFVENDSKLVVNGGSVINNNVGHVISLDENADVEVNSLVISDNGAGVIVEAAKGSSAVLNTLTISNNTGISLFYADENANITINGGSIAINKVFNIFNSYANSNLAIDGITISNNEIDNMLYTVDGKFTLENSIISTNNCSNELIFNAGDNSNITLNYNIILNNGESSFINEVNDYNFDYNWWGTNDKPNDYADIWVIMDVVVGKNLGTAIVNVYINKYTNGSDISSLSRNLPNGILVNVESSTGDFNKTLTINNGAASASFAIGENTFVNVTSDLANVVESLTPKTFYVDINFEGNGTGSIDAPFTSINDAITTAQDGDYVIVKEGVYSEVISWTGGKGLHIYGENDKVIFNLTSGSSISPSVKYLELINITFLGNQNSMSISISNNGNLNIVDCTFSGFILNNVLFTIANSNSNIENSNFVDIELIKSARQTGFIATYTGSGNHIIKNSVFDDLRHEATSRLYYSWGILYVNTASATLEMDNITMSKVYSISECLIRTNGILNVKNSKFIDNNVRKFKQGTRYYVGTSLFYNNNGKLTIETSVIDNNIGASYLIYHNGASSVSNINYNAIHNNVLSSGIATTTGTNNLDYNWWNASTPTYANANAWIVLDGYVSPDRIIPGDNITLIATFNHYITKDGVRGDTNHIIPHDDNVSFILPDGSVVNATTVNGEAGIPYSEIIGNETFIVQGSNQEATFSVKLSIMRLDVDENIIFVGENKTVKVLIPGINGTVDLIVDGKKETIDVVDGIAVKTIENLKAGKYSVVAIYKDGNIVDFDSKSFTVDKVSTQIGLEDITVNVGQTVPVEFTIAPDATGRVFMDVSGRKFFEYLEDESVSINLDLAIGNYTVTVSYEGDGKYDACEDSFKVTVNGFNADLKANASDIKVGENAVINIEINENATGTTNVIFGDSIIPVTFTDGKATVSIPDLANGTYTATVKFAGDSKFLAAETTVTFTVSKEELPSEINITTDIPEGTTAPEFTVNLPGDATGNFTVTVDGNNYTAPLVNGSATVKVPELTPGNHTISSSYSGDKKYDGFTSAAQTVEIPKASIPGGEEALNMTTPSDSANPSFSINLPKDATGNLTVTVDGKDTYTQALANGSATVDVPKLSEGKHNITVTYTGDDKYSSISKNTTVAVPVIKLSKNKNISMLYSAGTKYKVLVTVDGKAKAGVKVTFKFNGKTKAVTTDKKGYATYKIPTVKPKKAKYTITASYGGKTVKNTVKVNNIIKASNKNVKKSKKVTKVKITLKKVNKKYLKGKTLKIKFNKKTYKVKTNKKGTATWNVKKSMLKKLKVGKKYSYKVTYGKDVVTKKLTIKK